MKRIGILFEKSSAWSKIYEIILIKIKFQYNYIQQRSPNNLKIWIGHRYKIQYL